MENRKLSLFRLIITLFVFSGIVYLVLSRFLWSKKTELIEQGKPWYGPYIDVTAIPSYSFEQVDNFKSHKNAVLAFIVSSKKEACVPAWGSFYTLEEASSILDLDRRIARFRQLGGSIAISFGGALNDELAINCEDLEKLKAAYLSVIDRYEVDTIDFDIEGSALIDTDSILLRAEAISYIQKELRSQNKNLAVWLTLPVTPQGLTEDSANLISKMLEKGVDLAGVNVMTMNYAIGDSQEKSLLSLSETALIETRRQLGVLYSQAGIYLSDALLWSKVGATPMVGQNDIANEVFTLNDAVNLNDFSLKRGVGRISMWSANRDRKCGDNYVNLAVVSDSCSGIEQEPFAFSAALGRGFEGKISDNASLVTVNELKQSPDYIIDKPDESPYQIWSEKASYLKGTKVVWRKNVYVAKWWTRGDVPDNPVLNSWETPWQLVGPVLPGETPVPQPTLPAGTYPEWSGIIIYEAGSRVLFNGIPFEAKWWTQGDSPAASFSNPDSSPWFLLTQKDIEEINFY